MLLLSSGCGQAGGELDRLPFVAREGRLQRSTADGYEDLFLRGVNLGVAVRGTRAGELAATREQCYRWLARMGEIGLNSIRVYTLHYPRFHEAVRDYDLSHPASLDLAKIDTRGAPAGYFATYHAYPYYPDFISDDPAYASHSDSEGPNNYVGYLLDLKDHYWPVPLVIGEFGVPSSWGIAHYAASGANHGGFDEPGQGHEHGRLLGDVHGTGCAGGMIFAWIDAWWKRTWIVDDLNLPRDRYDLWHNVTSPEDNFRVIGFAAASRALETAESDGVVATLSLGGEVVSAGPFLWDEWDTVDPWVEYEKGSLEVFAEARGRSPRRGRGDGAWGPVRRC